MSSGDMSRHNSGSTEGPLSEYVPAESVLVIRLPCALNMRYAGLAVAAIWMSLGVGHMRFHQGLATQRMTVDKSSCLSLLFCQLCPAHTNDPQRSYGLVWKLVVLPCAQACYDGDAPSSCCL